MDNKPISIQIEDAKSAIINTINSLNLNPYILEPIIKDIHEAVLEAKVEQYRNDLNNTKKGETDGEHISTSSSN